MKNILTFIALAVFSISTFSAQSVPQLINYQAVAHNSAGSPLANQSVSATVIIRSGGATGPIVYQETHSVTTNQFGLFYYQIGSGTIVSGTFSAINWGAQPHFLNTVVNGDDLGTVQLISVPYALASQSTRGINNIPVSTTTPSNGNVLVFNGVSGQWESQAPSGVAGSNSILTSIVETPGANCLNGGYQMQYGTDDNNNSILDAGEIDGSYFICNGLDGVDGVSLNWLGTLATAPGAPNLNDGYYNSSLGQSFIWDGTTWQIIAQDGGGLTPGTTIGEVLTWNGTAWVAQIITETTTTLTNNGDGTFTFTNELGTTTTFDTTATAQTTSTLVNNGDGTFTYTDELGTTTTFDTTGVGDNWGTDIVNIAGGILSGDGTAGNPLTLNSIDDADADPTNEIQSLSISGNQINITGGAPALISNTAPTNSGEVLTWDGTNWVSQSLPSGSGWELTGNASTIPGVSAGENFLGTIDASDLLIATSSTPAMWISGTNQNVGIGISNPIGKLHVQTEGSSNFIISHTYSNVADEGGAFFALRARGNEAAPSEVLLGDRLGKLGFLAYNSGLSNYAEGAYIEATAEEDFISTGAGTSLRFHTTPLGLSTSQLAMTIDANQSVGIGTSTPSATLDVVGSFQLENASAAVGYVLTATDALGNAEWQPTAGGGTRLNDSDNDTYIEVDILGDGSENQIHFNLAGTEYFRMNGPTIETLNNSLSVFVGEGAGLNDDLTSNQGVFIGYFAGGANTTGQSNVGVGMLALGSNTTGGANTAVGGNVLNANVTGTGNTAIGFSSQQSSNGDQNTSVGNGSLNSNTTAANNTAVGTFALYNVTTGGNNTAIGMQALNTTSGANNTAIGFDAGTNNTTGFTNLFVGYNANASAGNLTNASAIGPNAIVTQSNSMVLGDGSIDVGIGTTSPTATLDVVGSFQLQNATAAVGYVLTAIDAQGNAEWQPPVMTTTYWNPNGNDIYNSNTGNIGIGTASPSAKLEVTDDILVNSIIIGKGAGNLNGNLVVGEGAFVANTSGTNNTAIGRAALQQNANGGENVALGFVSLGSNTTGYGNVGLGRAALSENVGGFHNVGVGDQVMFNNSSGFYNVAIGKTAMLTNTTGNRITTIGVNSDVAVGNLSNATAIGADAVVGASNSLVLGNNANVGIGTSTPLERLHVENGNIAITDDNYRIMRIDEGTDLVPVAYGVINDGTVQSNASTGNFTVFKQGIGEYQVNYTGTRPFAGPAEFQVILSTYELGGTITFATYEYVTNQSFIIRVYDIGGGTPSPSDGIVSFTLRVK